MDSLALELQVPSFNDAETLKRPYANIVSLKNLINMIIESYTARGMRLN